LELQLTQQAKLLINLPFLQKKNINLDTTFSYCKLIEIARQGQKDIEPIKEIKFEFDKKTKRFYWLIIQEIKNEKQGLNYYHQVIIDASDLKKAKVIKAKAYIDY